MITRAADYLQIEGGFDGFHAYVEALNKSLEIPESLSALGVKDPDIDHLVRDALEDPSTGSNPLPMNAENTRALLEACL